MNHRFFFTGAGRAEAERLLEACNGNLDLAVNMHMDDGEGGAGGGAENIAGSSSASDGAAVMW